jgi:GTP cyclohydrolase II
MALPNQQRRALAIHVLRFSGKIIGSNRVLFLEIPAGDSEWGSSGGRDWDRTSDLVVANDALSQLSYTPTLAAELHFNILLHRLRSAAHCVSTTAQPAPAITAAYNEAVTPSKVVQKVAEADFPTRWGHFRIFGFEGNFDSSGERRKETAVALVMGDIHSTPPLVRVHSQCLTGDVFGSLRCDCRAQLEMALSLIAEAGAGILLYEQQEGRGIGLMAKLQAYELQDQGLDTIEANERLGFKSDLREYALPGEVLKALDVNEVRLLSNNPEKVAALENAGVKVVERIPCEPDVSEHSEFYLKTKKEKMGHLFSR